MQVHDFQAIEAHIQNVARPPLPDEDGGEIPGGPIGDCCAYLVHIEPDDAAKELLGAKPEDKLFVAVTISDDATPTYAQALTGAVQDAVLAHFGTTCGVLLLDNIPRDEHGDNLRDWLANVT